MWKYKKKKKDDKIPLFDKAGIKVKKAPDYKAKLDKIFSMYIRLRDSKPYAYKAFRCVSCGQVKPFEQADCGHYVNRQHMALRFSTVNCNAQCRKCNRFDEGNLQGYRAELIRRHGEDKVLLLESMKYQTRKFSEFDYKELIKYYSALVKQMRDG